MSSLAELEEKNAVERRELMQSLFDHLKGNGIKAEIHKEAAINSLGMAVHESVIHLRGQNLNKIRLTGIDGGGCGVPGNTLRLQYEINLNKKLSSEEIKNMSAATRIIKEGKVMSLFGGKAVGVEWLGQGLAARLNQDAAIAGDLLKCVKSWSHLEFQIEAVPAGDVFIFGPRFSNPGMIAELYRSDSKEEIQCCVFGCATMEKIAGHIKAV